MTKTYFFQAKVWLYPGKAGWHFITVPSDITADIDYHFDHLKKGWGSLPVKVTVRNTTWETSIFPDKKSKSYLLPMKQEVRKKENVKEGDKLQLDLVVLGK